jgi:ATP-binding cassette, subfamily B, bacterial
VICARETTPREPTLHEPTPHEPAPRESMTDRPVIAPRRALRAAIALPWRAAPVASALGLALTIASGSIAALAAWSTKCLLDELARGSWLDADRAIALAILAATVGSSAVACWHALHYLDTRIRVQVTRTVERTLFAQVIALPDLRYFEDPQFHNRLRLAEEAARRAPQELAGLVQSAVRALVTVASLTGVVLGVWPPMALLLLAMGALGLAAQLFRVRYEARMLLQLSHSSRWQESFRSLLVDPRAAKEVRLFGAGELLHARMMARLETGARAELARERSSALVQIGLGLVGAGVTAAGAMTVVAQVIAGRLMLGDVALFTAAVAGIQTAFTGLVTQLGQAGPAFAGFRAYLEILAMTPPSVTVPREVPPLRHGIEVRDVWFRYSDAGPWVLRGVTLSIAAGAATGLVGSNGAGKSTLIKLLGRFHDVDRGAILWDGVDIRDFDPAALRRRIAATFQDYMTYDLSAAENIGIGEPAGLDDLPRIRGAAQLAEIDTALEALPIGYRTLLSRVLATDDPDTDPAGDGELRTASLSGGQWQRVALARALMRRDAELFVLDEPTSGLDADAEHRIHTMLDRHCAGRTRLLVSHRLNALRGAEVIAVLADGRITERGTHDELMTRGGVYARWFATQATGYQDVRLAGGIA